MPGRKPVKRRSASVSRPGLGTITAADTVFGRQSERLFERVATDVLHGNRGIFDNLTDRERAVVIEWLSDAIVDGEVRNSLHDVIWEIDYIRKPVDIDTFLHDDFYFGRVAKDLHPHWKDDLRVVFAPGSKIFEWVMTGAIGIGKTTLASVGMGYKVYQMSCLRDPVRYYGLLPNSLIVFGVYSITKRQVADTGYHNLRGYFDSSPYFRQQFPRSTKIDSKIDFEPRNNVPIQVIPGSQELHALGLNLFSFLMDEVNFMRVKDNKEAGVQTGQAYDLYNATYTRLQSRFVRPGGTLPGMMFLLSSRNAQTSFLEEHLAKVRGGDNPESTHISDYALWEVKNKKFTWPGFKVECGDRVAQSRLLKDEDKPRRGARVVEVPWEYRKPFSEDIDQALRDIAGVATFNLSPLIRDRQSVYDAVSEAMTHPFSKPTIELDIHDDVMVDEFFTLKSIARIKRSRWTPKLNPQAPRFIHIDIGLTGDALGFAMAHVAGKIKTEKVRPDGTVMTLVNPYVVVDLMLRVTAVPGGEVDLSKIRAFVLYLRRIGYLITKVTFDGFQSKDSMQILAKEEVDTGYQSIDRTDEAYLALRSALFDRRISMYEYGPFQDEVLDLMRERTTATANKWKVDHPTKATKGGKGSKDVSDAVAGAVWLCTNDPRAAQSIVADTDVEPPSRTKKKGKRPARKAADDVIPPAREAVPIGAAAQVTWDELRGNL